MLACRTPLVVLSRFTCSTVSTGSGFDVRVDLLHRPAGHHLDQAIVRQATRRHGVDLAPVAQHGDAVGNLVDLLHAVRDVDDADALGLQATDQFEQAKRLLVGERRGRLVQDQHRRLGAQPLGNLDHLLLGPRQPGHGAAAVDVELQVREHALGATDHRCPIEQQPAPRFLPQEQVLGNAECGHQREFLEHRADALLTRLAHRPQAHDASVQLDGSRSRRAHAGQQRDQRRLAGAVLAEQHVDLASTQIEIHPVERKHARVLLAEPAGPKNRHAALRDGRASAHPRIT